MLVVARYVAIAIMVFAIGDAVLNLYSAVALWFPTEDATENDSNGNETPATDEDATEESPSFFERVKTYFTDIVKALRGPLGEFCFGGILFLLVRIARDQAHDLATG